MLFFFLLLLCLFLQMSAPSLAGEIAQLHELFKLGALTAEEFNAAKQAAIRNFTAKTAAASPPTAGTVAAVEVITPPTPPPQQVLEAAEVSASPESAEVDSASSPSPPVPGAKGAPTRSRQEWQLLWSRSALHLPDHDAPQLVDPVDIRVQALRCAERLFGNLLAHPAEAKYRRIREQNKVVAQELLPVEASALLLGVAGFAREVEEGGKSRSEGNGGASSNNNSSSSTAALNGAAAMSPTFVWVQHDESTEASRKASMAARLVGDLLAYMGEQQARRYRVQQLWRSIALEVRLERAAREAAARGADVLDISSEPDQVCAPQIEETPAAKAAPPPHESPRIAKPFLAYLIECYTVDEAGDGLYSSLQHLQTLRRMYEEMQAPTRTSKEPVITSSSSFSLLESAAIYGAVVQQRGALELLLYGCGAEPHPFPTAAQQATTAVTQNGKSADTAVARPTASTLYTIDLLPPHLSADSTAHVARCLRLITRLQREVEAVQRQRAATARAAAETLMRRELRRERQRQQLEQSRVREEAEASSQSQLRRARLQGGAPQSTSSSSEEGEGAGSGSRRRIPIAEALAILMGKKSPPRSRPPAASSSSPPSGS